MSKEAIEKLKEAIKKLIEMKIFISEQSDEEANNIDIYTADKLYRMTDEALALLEPCHTCGGSGLTQIGIDDNGTIYKKPCPACQPADGLEKEARVWTYHAKTNDYDRENYFIDEGVKIIERLLAENAELKGKLDEYRK